MSTHAPYNGKYHPRGVALHRATLTRGIYEQPSGSNGDKRRDGISAWQKECAGGGSWLYGQPWCGVRCYDLLHTARVKGISSRLASVNLIEEDARARRGCFRGWTEDPHHVMRGDLVVLFGAGVHVGMVRALHFQNGRLAYLITEEGNTSSGVSGSQDNGGQTARRVRYASDVHGFALVNYPDHY